MIKRKVKDKKQKNLYGKYILSIGLIAFFLNLLWETLHSPLYVCRLPSFLPEVIKDCSLLLADEYWLIIASLIDGISIVFLIFIMSLVKGNFSWVKNPKKNSYLVFAFLGILLAVIYELYAYALGMWGYTDSMPVIFGIGLSPLVQLATTGVLALWIAKKFTRVS
ncbi:MAG: hypothetical protein WDZ69_00835 [Candidatus Pacearchaeota archaeon]